MTGAEATVVGALLGGGFVLGGTALTSVSGLKTAKVTAKAQADLEQAGRRQKRIEDAYIEIQIYVARCLDLVFACSSHWADSEDDVPLPPRMEEHRRAAVRLYSDDEVRTALDVFDSKFSSFLAYVDLYRTHKGDAVARLPGGVTDKRDARKAMMTLSEELNQISNALFERMHEDLTET
jgi:hypothetical protein